LAGRFQAQAEVIEGRAKVIRDSLVSTERTLAVNPDVDRANPPSKTASG
jgi:hypothetical protein